MSLTPRTYQNLAQFTKDNLINYEPDGVTISADVEVNQEDTCNFQGSQKSLEDSPDEYVNHNESEDELQTPDDIHQNAKDSGFFTRDFRVLKTATYGTPDPAIMLMKKFDEENEKLESSDTRHDELNEQTF